MVAPAVIALRSLDAARPSSRSRREAMRMTTEKVDAFSNAAIAMQLAWIRACSELPWVAMHGAWRAMLAGSTGSRSRASRATERHLERTAWRMFDAALTPIHTTATANLRRLSRRKR